MGLIRLLIFLLIGRFRGGAEAARWLGVKVGDDCRILTTHFGSEPWLISIGDRVTITSGVQFMTHDGSTWLARDQKGRRYRYAKIEIGDSVFVGCRTILLPGVRVGSRVIIGAGSVVSKSIPDGVIVAGNPARIVGKYADYEERVLAHCPSEADVRVQSYRERVDMMVESEFRPLIDS